MAVASGGRVRVGATGVIAGVAVGVGREPQPDRPRARAGRGYRQQPSDEARRSSLWVMIGLLAGSQDYLVRPSSQSRPDLGMPPRRHLQGRMGSWAVTLQAV